nr:PREDICTED: nectin-3-like [Lepisosteus oculatus]
MHKWKNRQTVVVGQKGNPAVHSLFLVKPAITVFTEDPIEEGETESRIATCRAENGKPAAKISWRTPFPTLGSMESSSMHEDLTITIESQLRAIPARSMHRQEVQCVVEHLSLAQPEVVSSKLTVQYPPSVVVIKIDTPTKLTFQCEADATPPWTDMIGKGRTRSSQTGQL